MNKWLWAVLTAAVAGLLAGCLPGLRKSSGANIDGVLASCAQRLAQASGEGEIGLVGIRDSNGKSTDSTRLLEEWLVSALLSAEVPLVGVAPEGGSWRTSPEVPIEQIKQQSQARVLAGRLYEREGRAYLRYWLVRRQGTFLEQSGTLMLDGAELAHLVAQGKGGQEGQVEVELQLIARHSEGGELRQVELAEGSVLQPGDQVQLRFRPRSDGQFYAFAISSEGERQELFPLSFVYTGPVQYGPGENGWITFDEPDRIQTIYFIAAAQLEEDRDEFFRDLDELILQRQVDRFEGLDKMDARVVRYAGRELGAEASVEVWRGADDISYGQSEKIIYEDGTAVESRAEKLRSANGLIRAISFEVQ